ncbi:hypothetical protein ACXIUT_12190 [Achromobacter denitrificans]
MSAGPGRLTLEERRLADFLGGLHQWLEYPTEEFAMQPDYEPYVALYKYGLNATLSMARNYFDYARHCARCS